MGLRRLLLVAAAASAAAFSAPVLPLGTSPSRTLPRASPLRPQVRSCPSSPPRIPTISDCAWQGRVGRQLTVVRVARSPNFERLTPEQQEAVLAIEAELTEVFRKYDKNRDGHLTMEEYNQWCLDTSRAYRMFTGELRFLAFCKTIKSDPAKGLSLQGLVELYSKADQQSRGSSALASASAPLVGVRACLPAMRARLSSACVSQRHSPRVSLRRRFRPLLSLFVPLAHCPRPPSPSSHHLPPAAAGHTLTSLTPRCPLSHPAAPLAQCASQALLVCIGLSIPYYLPSCTEYCRTLPWQ